MMVMHTGDGKPVVAIVACIHGNEPCGLAAIEAVKNANVRGTLKLIIANQAALAENRRFVNKDLNKAFPGNANGDYEDGIASQILEEVCGCDYLIDIHSTVESTEPFVISTRRNETNYALASYTGLDKLVLMPWYLKEGKALIDHHPAAISIECGSSNDPATCRRASDVVLNLLRNLSVIEGKAHKSNPERFEVNGIMHLPDSRFECFAGIKNFKKVNAGQAIGKSRDSVRYAEQDFYPVLFKEGCYLKDGVLCLMSRKI